ncbi:MAG: flagellar biosynthesis protein FlhB [Bacteroidetes bacterium]|nr:flagellar biosynthesis protein FlhB [Bacteroidota bacterium]
MADSDGQEKTEQATGKKLQTSREEGKVAKSTEISSFAIFSSGMILIYMSREFIGSKMSDLAFYVFNSLDTLQINSNIVQFYMLKAMLLFFLTLSPILIGLVIIGLVANIGQVGIHFSLKALSPKFNKMNPISGIKRILFSSSSLVEVLKSLLKLLLIGGFTYMILSDIIYESVSLVSLTISEIISFMIDGAFGLIWKIAMLYAILAIADFIFQKFKFKKDMMMTKQEVKEEAKQADGDPLIKSKIKSLQLEAARRRMMKDIPTADVVITNPTHFAVAIKYDPQKYAAPKVVAKGADELAQRIKKLAVENNVPLHENRELARALYKMCDVGDTIPEKLFQAVAKILAYIYNLKKTTKKKIV